MKLKNKIVNAIKRNITFNKKFKSEKSFAKWFEKNYKLLGFKKIIPYPEGWQRQQGVPDYKVLIDNKEIGVELETLSSHYKRHHHDDKKVDLVLCLVEDKKLKVNTIEITSFDFTGREMFTVPLFIDITEKKKIKFKVECIRSGVSIKDVINSAVDNYLKMNGKPKWLKK